MKCPYCHKTFDPAYMRDIPPEVDGSVTTTSTEDFVTGAALGGIASAISDLVSDDTPSAPDTPDSGSFESGGGDFGGGGASGDF